MSEDFYVGYLPVPQKNRRFLFKAVPAGLLGLTAVGGFVGARAASAGGGRWETGTPVTLEGRVGFHPQPILWSEGPNGLQAIVLAGIGKKGVDPYVKPFEGQSVRVTGIRIVRDDCFMLGVAEGNIEAIDADLPPLPEPVFESDVSLMGEIVDAQCFMGIMNPGYGRTHRGCATLCIRGGQPVYFSTDVSRKDHGASTGCGGVGFLLAREDGSKINADILDMVSRPVTLSGTLETLGPLKRLRLQTGSMKKV